LRIQCGDCPKEFRTQTGLDWHREHIHQELPDPQENRSDSTPTHMFPIDNRVVLTIPEGMFPATVTRHKGHSADCEPLYGLLLDIGNKATNIPESLLTLGVPPLTVATSGPYQVEPSTVALSAPAAPPIEELRTPGDYNCLDCRGANHLGGFFLKGAIAHQRETGHRLEHIPGSFEAALSQLISSAGPPTRA